MAVTTSIGNFIGGNIAAAVSARERNDGRAISRDQAPATIISFSAAARLLNRNRRQVSVVIDPESPLADVREAIVIFAQKDEYMKLPLTGARGTDGCSLVTASRACAGVPRFL
jgi:hypothetical protein